MEELVVRIQDLSDEDVKDIIHECDVILALRHEDKINEQIGDTNE